MKLLLIYLLFAAVVAVSSVYIASADSGGRPALSKKGCGGNSNCHSATRDTSVHISLTFDSTISKVVVGKKYEMTLKVTSSLPGKNCAGFDLKVAGLATSFYFTPGSNAIKSLPQELLHKSSLDMLTKDGWHFGYNARSTPGDDTIRIAALAANCDGSKDGDAWDTTTIIIPVSGPETPYLVSSDHLDLDPVDLGYSDTATYPISNGGSKTLSVTNIHMAVGKNYKLLESDNLFLDPNAVASIKVLFTPDSMGYFSDTLIMSSNDPQVALKKVPAYSEGLKAICVFQSSSIYISVDSGSIGSASFFISNKGNRPFRVTNASVSLGFEALFGTLPRNVNPNEKMLLTIYAPGDKLGVKQGIFMVHGELDHDRTFDSIVSITAEVVPLAYVNEEFSQRILLKPNPTQSTITVEPEGEAGVPSTVTILDISGKELYRFAADHFPVTYSIVALPSGKYYVELHSSKKTLRTSFIKQ